MADYSNIKRVVIRKPTGLRDWCEALNKLTVAKRSLDTLQKAAKQGIIPQAIFSYQMTEVENLIYEATRLAGFDNPDDMKYFIENFKDL